MARAKNKNFRMCHANVRYIVLYSNVLLGFFLNYQIGIFDSKVFIAFFFERFNRKELKVSVIEVRFCSKRMRQGSVS